MSKVSRLKKKEEKKKRKLQKKALYEAYAKAGRMKRSKQQNRPEFGYGPNKGSHPQQPCGNPACGRCYPREEKCPVNLEKKGGA